MLMYASCGGRSMLDRDAGRSAKHRGGNIMSAGSSSTEAPRPGQAFRRLDLQIQFLTEKDGHTIVRGEEVASYDWNDDSSITFRATSRSSSPKVTRDIIYTLDQNYRPLDAFTRIQVDGHYEG